MNNIWKFLVYLDRKINDDWLHGKFETISSRLYRKHKVCSLCKYICVILNEIDKDHCKNSYLNDIKNNPTIPKVEWVVEE